MTSLETRLADIVRADPGLMHVLTTVRGLGLDDWRVFSGAVYQSVWNAVTGRPTGYGISVAAPFGLEDVFSLTIRPNPDRPLARGWDKAVANATARWPELTIVEPEIK